jgi:hypothetical protein
MLTLFFLQRALSGFVGDGAGLIEFKEECMQLQPRAALDHLLHRVSSRDLVNLPLRWRHQEKEKPTSDKKGWENGKKDAAPQYSHVVPDHTTDWAVRWLTLQIGRDAVFSASYGRIR